MYDNFKDRAIKSLIRSTDKKDQKFVNLFRIRQAQRYGVKIGFKGFDCDSQKETDKPLLESKNESNCAKEEEPIFIKLPQRI